MVEPQSTPRRGEAKNSLSIGQEVKMAPPIFRDYFAAAQAHAGLTEREKQFIGLAVTMSRGCEP